MPSSPTHKWEYEDEEADDYEWEYETSEEETNEKKDDEENDEDDIPLEDQDLPDPFSTAPLQATTKKDVKKELLRRAVAQIKGASTNRQE